MKVEERAEEKTGKDQKDKRSIGEHDDIWSGVVRNLSCWSDRGGVLAGVNTEAPADKSPLCWPINPKRLGPECTKYAGRLKAALHLLRSCFIYPGAEFYF